MAAQPLVPTTPTASAFAALTQSLGTLDQSFASLVRSVDAAASRLAGLASDGAGAAGPAVAGAGGLAAGVFLDPADLERLTALEDQRVASQRALVDSSGDVLGNTELIAEAQDDAARQSAVVWDGFAARPGPRSGGDMAGSFDSLFSRVVRDGEIELGDLWDTVGKQFARPGPRSRVDTFAKLDLGPVIGPLMGQFSGIVDAALGFGTGGNTGGIIQGLMGALSGIFGGSGGGEAGLDTGGAR